ncbi:MAG TPA: sulfotransferase [Rudaea sp.]|jgi:tetratricopeptide (TPR) repeat protein|nr:sulfotransferase [Rudaea sp.]
MHESPTAVEARYERGNELRMDGRFAEAESEFRHVLAQHPSHRDATFSLAFMLREQGRTDAAAQVVSTWWRHVQSDADDSLRVIGFLAECFAHQSAYDVATAALQRWPDDARIAARAGDEALALGRFHDAQTFLRKALALDPNQSASWLRLSHCRRFTDSADADIASFRNAANDDRLTPLTRACAGFALGKALDDIGDIEHAAAALRAANERTRAWVTWDSVAWSSFVDQRLRERMAESSPPSTFEPVFVIGMPRTGTTLVSTLLGGFDGVRDRGELNWIPAVYAQLRELDRLDDPQALRACADLIQAHMRRDDAPARFYIDKNPLNFAYVDFIVAMFPRARFMHCRRDVRDTALSIWSQQFGHEALAFAYDFPSIVQVQKDHQRFMTRWRERFAARIIDIEYEAVVSEPDAQTRRLGDFLGVARATDATDSQAVTTASVWQARQPVYARSVGRWKNYAPYLPELAALTD